MFFSPVICNHNGKKEHYLQNRRLRCAEMEHERDLCCDVEIRKNNPCELKNGMQI